MMPFLPKNEIIHKSVCITQKCMHPSLLKICIW